MTTRLAMLFLILLPWSALGQQNLVINHSFEDLVSCPTADQDWNVINWTNPIGFSPDNYNTCASPAANYSAGVPLNVHGFQNAFDGDGYVGIGSFSTTSPDSREYIQTVLADTLTGGIRYYVGFHVSPADRFQYGIRTIGAALTVEPPPIITVSSPNGMLGADPQVLPPGRLPLTDTANWVLVSDTVLAQGGERYLSLGNFHSDGESDTVRFNPNQPPIYGSPTTYAYYYIDDVFVYAIDSVPNSVTELQEKEESHFGMYPNPTAGSLTIEGAIERGEMAVLEVFNLVGQVVLSQQLTNGEVHRVDVTGLVEGMYSVRITINSKVQYTNKLSVLR